MISNSVSNVDDFQQLSHLSVDGHAFTLECYDNLNAITSLQTEWQLLESVCLEDFTYYQSFNWCFEYYKQFADDLTDKHCPIPQVFVLRKNNTPVMIWPMMRIQSRTGLKILTSATEPLGQYCNLLFDASSFNEKVGQVVLQVIIENSKSDSISFNNYPVGCLIEKIIGEQGIREKSDLKSAILDMSQYESWEAYNQTLSKGQRKERRRNKNKLETQGTLSYEVYEAGSEEYKSLVTSALRMKTQWLVETGRKQGILADECTNAMFCNPKAVNTGGLNGPLTHALYLDKKPIAIEVCMVHANRYYSYLGAIDWDWKEFGLGKMQMAAAQEWAMNQGIKNFDLSHDPSEYKSSWTNTTHKVISCNIPITYKGYVYSKFWKTYLRPKIKSFYHFARTKNRTRLNKIADIFRK